MSLHLYGIFGHLKFVSLQRRICARYILLGIKLETRKLKLFKRDSGTSEEMWSNHSRPVSLSAHVDHFSGHHINVLFVISAMMAFTWIGFIKELSNGPFKLKKYVLYFLARLENSVHLNLLACNLNFSYHGLAVLFLLN